MGSVVMPGAAFTEIALAAAGTDSVAELRFEQPLRPSGRMGLQTLVRPSGDGDHSVVETYSTSANDATGDTTWARHFSARIVSPNSPTESPVDLEEQRSALHDSVSVDEFYASLANVGLEYGPSFRTVKALHYSSTAVLAHLSSTNDVRGYGLPPTVLDGAFHSLAICLLKDAADEGFVYLPTGIGRIDRLRNVEGDIWCHAVLKKAEGKSRWADLRLLDNDGRVLVVIEDLCVEKVSVAALRRISGSGAERLVTRLAWQPTRLASPVGRSTKWLLLRTTKECRLADGISTALVSDGHEVQQHVVSQNDGAPPLASLFGENQEWDGITWVFGDGANEDRATEDNIRGILKLLDEMAKAGCSDLACGLQLITTDGVVAGTDEPHAVRPDQAMFWGLGRVLGAERPNLRCRIVDVPSSGQGNAATASLVREIALTETQDSQFAVRGDQILVPRLEKFRRVPSKSQEYAAKPNHAYLVTGGLGMLGRQVAAWLVEKGACQVVLVSRRQPSDSAREFLDTLVEKGCDIVVHQEDVGDRSATEALFARFGRDLLPLCGVVHAAGVLDDGLLESQTWERFQTVLRAKKSAAELLDEFTADLDLDLFVLYSSAASILGSPGQSNYASGNAFLDGLAWRRRCRGLPALSINWGPWTEGMAANERLVQRLAMQGITPLTVAEAHQAMEALLASNETQAMVIDVDWSRLRRSMVGAPLSILDSVAGEKRVSGGSVSALVERLRGMERTPRRELLLTTIQGSLQSILSTPELPDTHRPLIEMGLDSLMAVEFGTDLQGMLGDQFSVNPAMLFDHPTIEAITDHVIEMIEENQEPAATTAEPSPSDPLASTTARREEIAIIGMSCRFPGANSVDEYWHNLIHGVDSVGEIPPDRWDIDRFYSETFEPGKMVSRQGGFLEDIGDFDPAFFNIAPQEACWIDPQHRMLLENTYHALEDAGVVQKKSDNKVGVFMGIMGQDYAFLPTLDDRQVIDGFKGAGLSHSAAVGRISYHFGFEGPSVAVDSASSSSLVALFQAVRSLQERSCNLAVAGGVNAILAPVNSLLMSKAGLLARDGRCKSFSANADGFGRGEGCGVVVLKRLSDAERDGDRILAVVKGAAVQHNGRASGITSPSGKAQVKVIEQALRDARVAPSEVQYLEAHGTGTEFGDTIELQAASTVYAKGRAKEDPLLVGSAKANVSHLEAAGGMTGLIKTVLAIQHGVIPPQIHFDEPSRQVPWDRLPIQVVRDATEWPKDAHPMAAVTALGLVGTNAHVIVGAPPTVDVEEEGQDALADEMHSHLLVLSAKSEAALGALRKNYARFFRDHSEVNLANVCYSAGARRQHHAHRFATICNSAETAIQQLEGTGSLRLSSGTHKNGQRRELHHGHTNPNRPTTCPRMAWLFPQLNRAESNLHAIEQLCHAYPAFAESIREFEHRTCRHLKWDSFVVQDALSWCSQEEACEYLSYVLQAAQARLWLSWGLEPDAVLGFGPGELVAAAVAGCVGFEDGLILAYERARLLHRDQPPLDEELDGFETIADQFNYYPPKLPLVATDTAELVPVHRSLGGTYWRQQLAAASEIESPLACLMGLGCERTLFFGWNGATTFDLPGIIRLGQHENAAISAKLALAEIYELGITPDFQAVYSGCNRQIVSLPKYPFEKQRYWITEIEQHMRPSPQQPKVRKHRETQGRT